MGPLPPLAGVIIAVLFVVLIVFLFLKADPKVAVIAAFAIIALMAVWTFGGGKGWFPVIPPVNYHINTLEESWTQILSPEQNIENEKRSVILYLDQPHPDLAQKFVMGWGRPKSKEPKLVTLGYIERNDGKIISQTLKFYIIRNFWFWKPWQYLGEEKLVVKNLPGEGRMMFSPDSKFGKRLKKFFLEDLKLEKEEFLKSIPVITPIGFEGEEE